jgi:hypothetical protein
MGLTRTARPSGDVSETGGDLLIEPEVYLVSYKLSWPEEQYTSLIWALKHSIEWWHYLPSLWLVIRKETLVDFSQILRKRMTANDWLLVLPARGPGGGILPVEAWQWLNEKLPREW